MTDSLTPETIQRLTNNLCRLLEMNYVLQETVADLVTQLEAQAVTAAQPEEPQAFAARLTETLYNLSGDGHLSLLYDPQRAERLKQLQNNRGHTDDAPKVSGPQPQTIIQQVTCLTGDIGYIALRDLLATPHAFDAVTAAFQLVGGCRAVILDLRQNYGGEVSMVQWIASYLLDAPRLLHIYDDPRMGFQRQIWSYASVPGIRLAHIPVTILVSANTFSAAEELAYDLQAMGRATVIGTQTGGGAHLTESHAAGYGFVVNIPVARVVNLITGTNWQGSGVVPDMACDAAEALAVAHLHTLETLIQSAEEALRPQLLWDMETVKARQQRPTLDPDLLVHCVGDYGDRRITQQNGQLHLHFQHTVNALLPLSQWVFRLAEQDQVQVEFFYDGDGVTGLSVIQRETLSGITRARS